MSPDLAFGQRCGPRLRDVSELVVSREHPGPDPATGHDLHEEALVASATYGMGGCRLPEQGQRRVAIAAGKTAGGAAVSEPIHISEILPATMRRIRQRMDRARRRQARSRKRLRLAGPIRPAEKRILS